MSKIYRSKNTKVSKSKKHKRLWKINEIKSKRSQILWLCYFKIRFASWRYSVFLHVMPCCRCGIIGTPYKWVFSEREDVNACTTVMISKETTGTMITSLIETSTSVKDGHHSQIVRSASQNQHTELTTDEIGTKTWRRSVRCEIKRFYRMKLS